MSASLIVKNEEAYLEGCLLSVRGVADEVVVVDTGSDDRTRGIAEEAGARLFEFPWTNNFSEARNEALRHCRGEWILWVDADERLRRVSKAKLTDLLMDGSKVAYYVLLHRRPGFTPNWQLRLFRNHPRIRYQGVIHEATGIYRGVDYLCQAGRKGVGYSCLVYDHLGYEHNQEQKARRNLPLLLEALSQEPERIFVRCHLARTYAALGEHSLADEAWKAGIEIVRSKRNLHIGDSYPYVGMIESEIRRGRHPSDLVMEARQMFPGNLQLIWYQGRLWMDEGRYREAVPLFQQLVDCGQTNAFDHSIGYDQRLLGEFALESLAECHHRLGTMPESGQYSQLAEQCGTWRGDDGGKRTSIGKLSALSLEFPGYYGQIRHRDENPDPGLYRLD